MTDLKNVLQELADAPRPDESGRVAASELWDRGVRRRRIRTLAAVAATIGVVAAGAGIGVLVNHRHDVPPTGGTVRGDHLPRSIGVPDPSSAGTADAGPLGRLAVLWLATRDGHPWGSFFGISARSGTYRFLDLPKIAGPADVALSPDGREVAYWTTGRVDGGAVKYIGNDEQMATVDGIARYDTVTGRTRFEPIASAHGLDPEGIRWTDDTTVLFEYAHVLNRRAANRITDMAWGESGDLERVDRMVDLDNWTSMLGGNHVVETGNGFRLLETGAEHRPSGNAIRGLPHLNWGQVTTDGKYVAAQRVGPNPTMFSGRSVLRYGRLEADGVGTMSQVKGIQVAGIVGWAAPRRLLVVGMSKGPTSAVLSEVDLNTGVAQTEGTIRNPDRWPGTPQYAVSLLTKPLVERAIPKVSDHHWPLAAVGSFAALFLAGGFVLWRRRARG